MPQDPESLYFILALLRGPDAPDSRLLKNLFTERIRFWLYQTPSSWSPKGTGFPWLSRAVGLKEVIFSRGGKASFLDELRNELGHRSYLLHYLDHAEMAFHALSSLNPNNEEISILLRWSKGFQNPLSLDEPLAEAEQDIDKLLI